MLKFLVAVLVIGVFAVACTDTSIDGLANEPAASTETIFADFDLAADVEVFVTESAERGEFSGAVLVARNGSVLFTEAYGFANREEGVPNTLDTRHRIGSMNKMFTSVAVLQLVEAGLVDLNAPIGAYIPDYPNEEIATTVTIHHLLTHTGGTGDIFGPDFDAHRLELRDHDDYVELYGGRGPAFAPGSQFSYSNYGYVLLGSVIEQVTGQTYYDYVQENVYEPSGMDATGSLPEDVHVPNRSVGYTGPPSNMVPNDDTLPYRGTAAGGGYSTVADLARFGQSLLDHQLLGPETTDLLFTFKVELRPHVGYAYGFEDERATDGSVGHSGGAPGMNGDLRIFPESGYVEAVLANMDPPAAQQISTYLRGRIEPHR